MAGEILSYAAWTAVVIAGIVVGLRLFWRAKGSYKLWKAGPRPLFVARHRLWTDPGAVESLDMTSGPGGREQAPVQPYRFIEEHSTGTQPCVSVHDANGRRWRVKWGHEVPCETFAVRLAWACGYFAEVTHLVPSGTIEGAGKLSRAASCLDEKGCFVDGRFELDDPEVEKSSKSTLVVDRQPVRGHAAARRA